MVFDLKAVEPQSKLAVIDTQGISLSYAELHVFSERFFEAIGERTLIFILSENRAAALAAYVSCLNNKVVPLLLSANTDQVLLQHLIEVYQPSHIWHPENHAWGSDRNSLFSEMGFSLSETGFTAPQLHPDLSLLLSTSGTTGSPKLVRHSYANVQSSSANVSRLFNLTGNERAIAFLPMQYTMGLSVVSSHLYAGATVLLADAALTDSKFWSFIKEHEATSFTGVPYSFEILDKLRFYRMKLPSLKVLSQGGGKLEPSLFEKFAKYCAENSMDFIATYGQTEGTARMAYLPAEFATSKTSSIGVAIPGGKLFLVDQDKNSIEATEASGELAYEGPNVTLGYAEEAADLSLGDENKGLLYTGDLARREADGFYFITGRLKRFLKIYGLRISLDELENLIKTSFKTDCICKGNDQLLEIAITDESLVEKVKEFVKEKTGLFHQAYTVKYLAELPKSEAGKPIY